jgi:hypothetical protein
MDPKEAAFGSVRNQQGFPMSKLYPYSRRTAVDLGLAPGWIRMNLSGSPAMGAITPINPGGVAISCVAITTGAGVGTIPIGDFNRIVLGATGSGNSLQPVATAQARTVSIQGIKANVSFIKQDANITATWSATWGLGTAPKTTATALTGAEIDVLGGASGQAIGPAVAGKIVAPEVVLTAFNTKTTAWAVADEMNLNLLVGAADITDGATGIVKAYGYIDFLLGLL